jgi:hypothetical protein
MARSDPGAALISADVRRTIRGPLAERIVSRGLMQLDKMAEHVAQGARFYEGTVPRRSCVTRKKVAYHVTVFKRSIHRTQEEEACQI